MQDQGRVGTKPGLLLKSQIPERTWAEWDDVVSGFVEIDTVFHDGGNRGGGQASTMTVIDRVESPLLRAKWRTEWRAADCTAAQPDWNQNR